MSTQLSTIYDNFLKQIDDEIMVFMNEKFGEQFIEDLLLSYLKGAIAKFKTYEKGIHLVPPTEDSSGYIQEDLSQKEINILVMGMITIWLNPKIFCEDKLKQAITDGDYNRLSSANMLSKLLNLKEYADDYFRAEMIEYSYGDDFEGFY